jgi:chromosome segregation ATPase
MSPKSQSQQAIDNLLEQVSRHDERIKSVCEDHESVKSTIDEIKKEILDLKLNIESYKLKIENINGFWNRIFDSGWKIAIMILGAYILYMLKLQSN